MTFALIFILTTGLLLLMIRIFEPKKAKSDWTEILITKTSITFIGFSIYILLSFLFISNYSDKTSGNSVGQVISFLLYIPFIVPFILGYGGHEILAYMTIILEIIILTLLFRPLISMDFVKKIRLVFINNGT